MVGFISLDHTLTPFLTQRLVYRAEITLMSHRCLNWPEFPKTGRIREKPRRSRGKEKQQLRMASTWIGPSAASQLSPAA